MSSLVKMNSGGICWHQPGAADPKVVAIWIGGGEGREEKGREGKGRENGIGNRAATREVQISPIGGSQTNHNGGLNLPHL